MKRELKALGLIYSLIVISAITALLFIFWKFQHTESGIIYSGAALAFVIVSIHFARKDHRFIKLTDESPSKVYFTEYLAFTLPFILLSLIAYGKTYQLILILVS